MVDFCITPKALVLFVGMLDPSIIEIVSPTELIIHAKIQSVSYQYVEKHETFCIDGKFVIKGGELL